MIATAATTDLVATAALALAVLSALARTATTSASPPRQARHRAGGRHRRAGT